MMSIILLLPVAISTDRSTDRPCGLDRKVDTTAADNNKQGDVQAMDFGIPGYEHLVWDVSLVSDRMDWQQLAAWSQW